QRAARHARHVSRPGGLQPRVDLRLLPAAPARRAPEAGPGEDQPGREAPERAARRVGRGGGEVMHPGYSRLVELAERELELVRGERLDELSALWDERRRVVTELPYVP